jgi:hypothetical protein
MLTRNRTAQGSQLMAGDSFERAFERHAAEIATSLREPPPERNGCAPLPISRVGCPAGFCYPISYSKRHVSGRELTVTQGKFQVSISIVAAAVAASTTTLLAQGRAVTPADQAAGQAWWAHIKTLASDNMEGRLTGSEGYLRAARYVVTQFEEAHLQPAGVNGYYQPIQFDVTRLAAEKSSMALVVNGVKQTLSIGPDAVLAARANQPKIVTAPLVFIGYGLHLPEAKYDDFNSAEVPFSSLKGKIVVLINGGPADLPTALKSFARTQPLQKALVDAGALGAITIPTPKSMDVPWDRVVSNSSQPGMRLTATPGDSAIAARHPALADQRAPMFAAQFNPAQAEKLFAGSGHSFGELLALADAQKPLPRFDLKKSLVATVALETSAVESPNIAAKLEGSDPGLKNGLARGICG